MNLVDATTHDKQLKLKRSGKRDFEILELVEVNAGVKTISKEAAEKIPTTWSPIERAAELENIRERHLEAQKKRRTRLFKDLRK